MKIVGVVLSLSLLTWNSLKIDHEIDQNQRKCRHNGREYDEGQIVGNYECRNGRWVPIS